MTTKAEKRNPYGHFLKLRVQAYCPRNSDIFLDFQIEVERTWFLTNACQKLSYPLPFPVSTDPGGTCHAANDLKLTKFWFATWCFFEINFNAIFWQFFHKNAKNSNITQNMGIKSSKILEAGIGVTISTLLVNKRAWLSLIPKQELGFVSIKSLWCSASCHQLSIHLARIGHQITSFNNNLYRELQWHTMV